MPVLIDWHSHHTPPEIVQEIVGLGATPPRPDPLDSPDFSHRIRELDGSGSSDPEGGPLTYSWSLTAPDGSTAALSDAAVVNPTFVPDLAGVYVATLLVNDGTGDSEPDTVEITAE